MDISAVTSNTYDKIVLLAEAWQSKPAFTFYIDDIKLMKKGLTAVEIASDSKTSMYYSSLQNTLNIKCDRAGLLELITLTGVVTKSVNIHGDTTLKLSDIQNGVYIVRLKNSGTRVVQKIIVGNPL